MERVEDTIFNTACLNGRKKEKETEMEHIIQEGRVRLGRLSCLVGPDGFARLVQFGSFGLECVGWVTMSRAAFKLEFQFEILEEILCICEHTI